MLKGVSQKVIEVVHTDNKHFEKAILFLRPSHENQDSSKLKLWAGEYLSQISYSPNRRTEKKGVNIAGIFHAALGMLIGAGITSMVFLLL